MKNKSMKTNPFSSRAFKKGSLSVVFVSVIVVAVILLNVIVSAVSNRYPFSIDLTSGKDYTIGLSEEHENFIKNIGTDINITVCANEDDFKESGAFSYNMVNTLQLTDNYYGTIQEITDKYARQTYMFIRSFPTINNKIKLEFRDSNSVTDFASVKSKYPSENLSYGDIIVSCNHKAASGETYERYRIIKISDLFEVEANSDLRNYTYYTNEITGSTLATEITSALYIVTSESSVSVAVLGGHGAQTADGEETQIAGLKTLLSKNNYTFTDVENILTGKIPEDAAMTVIFRPTNDYTPEEIRVLSDYLQNGGAFGKNLVYVPATAQPALPNLEEFLAEWGIQMLPEISFDDSDYYYTNNYIFAQPADSKYTENFDTQNNYFYPSAYRLAKTVFDKNDTRYTTKILVSPDSSVGMPVDASSGWTSSQATDKGPFDLVVMGSDAAYDSNGNITNESHVLMLSGDIFLDDAVLSQNGCYNAAFTLAVFNDLAGVRDNTNAVEITPKTINASNFSDILINSPAPNFMYIIFVGIIPVTLIIVGIVIWNKRRNRV